MHDSRIYTNSKIGQTIEVKLAGTDYHIPGDAVYPLSKRLMKRYPRSARGEVFFFKSTN